MSRNEGWPYEFQELRGIKRGDGATQKIEERTERNTSEERGDAKSTERNLKRISELFRCPNFGCGKNYG